MDIDVEHNLRHKDCLLKYVKVKTVDKCEHEGWLKCIDPLSGNLFLVTFDEAFTEVLDVVLIMGDGYTSLEVLQDSDDKIKNVISGLYSSGSSHCPENVSDRKNRLISWIQKNRLPLQEKDDESLLVCESVTICPPYDIDNCSSLNGRVLKNIRHLIAKLPPPESSASNSQTV